MDGRYVLLICDIYKDLSNAFLYIQGDKWAYSFDVVHDIPRLIQYRGGNIKFIQSLDDHFIGGHNDHTNEVRFPTRALNCLILIL